MTYPLLIRPEIISMQSYLGIMCVSGCLEAAFHAGEEHGGAQRAFAGDCPYAFGEQFPLRMGWRDGFSKGRLAVEGPSLTWTRQDASTEAPAPTHWLAYLTLESLQSMTASKGPVGDAGAKSSAQTDYRCG